MRLATWLSTQLLSRLLPSLLVLVAARASLLAIVRLFLPDALRRYNFVELGFVCIATICGSISVGQVTDGHWWLGLMLAATALVYKKLAEQLMQARQWPTYRSPD